MIEREKIKEYPICGSEDLEHKLGNHVSKIRGVTHNVPQTVCHKCGEIFFGPDSLQVIRSQEARAKHA